MVKRCGTTLVMAVSFVLLAGPASLAAPQAHLTPDASPIKYVQQQPPMGTPQEAMLNLVLFRNQGRTGEASELISKSCPDWLRKSMLEPQGPMKMETLTYQLREYSPEKALVSVDFNLQSGTFVGWTRSVVYEDGKWVVR